jgi:hypothetical protein
MVILCINQCIRTGALPDSRADIRRFITQYQHIRRKQDGGGDGPDIQPSAGFTRVAMTAKMALRDIASARSCIAESSRIVAFTDT